MDPHVPGVAVGLHRFRFAHQVVVVPVFRAPAAHERLEVGAVLHAVGRVEIDGLDLPPQSLETQQGVHDQQGVAEDQPVRPVVLVFVGPQQAFVEGNRPLAEEARRQRFGAALHRGQNGLGRQPLVDEQRQGRHFEGQPLRFPGPVEKRAGKALQRGGVVANLPQLLYRRLARGRGEGFRAVTERPQQRVHPPLDGGDLPVRFLAPRVLPVPLERRGERRVVAVLARGLPRLEVRLRPDVRPAQGGGLRVAVGVDLSLPGTLGRAHRGAVRRCRGGRSMWPESEGSSTGPVRRRR